MKSVEDLYFVRGSVRGSVRGTGGSEPENPESPDRSANPEDRPSMVDAHYMRERHSRTESAGTRQRGGGKTGIKCRAKEERDTLTEVAGIG